MLLHFYLLSLLRLLLVKDRVVKHLNTSIHSCETKLFYLARVIFGCLSQDVWSQSEWVCEEGMDEDQLLGHRPCYAGLLVLSPRHRGEAP